MIRLMKDEDWTQVLFLLYHMHSEHRTLSPYLITTNIKSEEDMAIAKEKILSYDKSLFTPYVYEKDNQIAGYMLLAKKSTPDQVFMKGQEFIHVEILVVHPEFQSQGIGSEFLDFAKEKTREWGYHILDLDLLASNEKALRVYEKKGFISTVIRMQYYIDDTTK